MNVHGNQPPLKHSSQAIGKRAGISRTVVFAIRLRTRDDDAVVQAGAMQKPRDRQSADDPTLGQSLDQFVRGPWRAHDELVEEMRVDYSDRRNRAKTIGELHRVGVVDSRQAFEAHGAEQSEMDRECERA